MTYQKLFQLKFSEGVSTSELARRYPHDIRRVSEVALLDIPEGTLREIISEQKAFNRLMRLKRRYSRFF